MKIQNARQFIFHPFSEGHSSKTKAAAIVTDIALSVVSGFIFLIPFVYVQIKDRNIKIFSGKFKREWPEIKKEIYELSSLSEYVLNTTANISLVNKNKEEKSMRSLVQSGLEWRKALADWNSSNENAYFLTCSFKEIDRPLMKKLKTFASKEESKEVFIDAYRIKEAKRKGNIYISTPIVKAMKLTKTKSDRAEVAPYTISSALERHPQGMLVNPEKLKKLLDNKTVQETKMERTFLDHAENENLKMIYKILENSVWDTFEYQGRDECKNKAEIFVTALKKQGNIECVLEDILIIANTIGFGECQKNIENNFNSELAVKAQEYIKECKQLRNDATF